MRSVDISVLERKPSRYVRPATGGETVLVTERGVLVAELRPPTGSGEGPVLASKQTAIALAV